MLSTTKNDFVHAWQTLVCATPTYTTRFWWNLTEILCAKLCSVHFVVKHIIRIFHLADFCMSYGTLLILIFFLQSCMIGFQWNLIKYWVPSVVVRIVRTFIVASFCKSNGSLLTLCWETYFKKVKKKQHIVLVIIFVFRTVLNDVHVQYVFTTMKIFYQKFKCSQTVKKKKPSAFSN